MNILHAHTDPTMLDRLKSLLAHSQQADIAVVYPFIAARAGDAAKVLKWVRLGRRGRAG